MAPLPSRVQGPTFREPRRSDPAPRGAGAASSGVLGSRTNSGLRGAAQTYACENNGQPQHSKNAWGRSSPGASQKVLRPGTAKVAGGSRAAGAAAPEKALRDITNTGPAQRATGSKMLKTSQSARVVARSSATEGSKPGAGFKLANPGASSSPSAGSSIATPAPPEYVPVPVQAQAPVDMVVEPPSIAEPSLVAPAQPEDLEPFPCDEDNDVQLVTEYAHGIFEVLFQEEALALPNPNYIESQTDINARMRGILVDWLVEVHTKYRLRQQVLFLTVNLIDRYLSVGPVISRRKLQLVGVAAMFISAKFEEIDPPQVKDFVYITDNAYTKEEVLQAECSMLGTLGFHVVVPTAEEFLERLCRAHCCDSRHRSLAQYILELALVDVRSLQYRPSHQAAASLLLSNELLGERVAWPSSLARCARYTEASLRPCVSDLRAIHEAAPRHSLQAVRKKFQLRQNNSVATLYTQAQGPHLA